MKDLIKQETLVVRNNLDEISFARPILLLLVVLYHAMAIHTGNWDLPEGVAVISVYKLIGRLSYAFMLESFVFVSGYVWAYQRETRGKKERFWKLCKKKFFRLLLPAVLFGILYIFLFEPDKFSVMLLVEGPGHLWFLLMLFECFIIGWCLLKLRLLSVWLLSLLFLVAVFRPSDLPLRMSYTLYYLPFFMLGYYVYLKFEVLKECLHLKHILMFWVFFFVSYFSMVTLRQWLILHISSAFLLGGAKTGCTIVYSLIGTYALLCTAIYVTKKKSIPSWYIHAGGLCMGVYIFQQFVLEIVYYHSPIPTSVSNWFLPIVGFLLALIISLTLTSLIRYTKIGKMIL